MDPFGYITAYMEKLIASLKSYSKAPRGTCDSTSCVQPSFDHDMTAGEVNSYLSSFDANQRSSSRKSRVSVIKYGKTALGEDLRVILLRPYIGRARNAKQRKKRHAVWIETGFEGKLKIGPTLANLLIDYKSKYCVIHCNYDYYIVPLANPDGYGKVNSSMNQEHINGTACKGVSLLHNFAYGNFSAANNDPCSDQYRGPFPMSAVETHYQTLIKPACKDIALSVTLTRMGSVVSVPFAHKLEIGSEYKDYLKIFKIWAGDHYKSGVYSQMHHIDYGHPLDYNEHQHYGYSFNVAVEKGLDSLDPYTHNSTEVKNAFDNMMKGVFSMLTYAKYHRNFGH